MGRGERQKGRKGEREKGRRGEREKGKGERKGDGIFHFLFSIFHLSFFISTANVSTNA